MAKKRNIIVGQSGGPTSVINSSLAGVYKNAIERGFDKVYGMLHGIQGLLDEQYIDLSTQIHSELDIELLKDVYKRQIIGILKRKRVFYLFLFSKDNIPKGEGYMDTPIIAQYYRETEPEKRKELLEQAIASGEDQEANKIRKEIWEARYKGTKMCIRDRI